MTATNSFVRRKAPTRGFSEIKDIKIITAENILLVVAGLDKATISMHWYSSVSLTDHASEQIILKTVCHFKGQ